MSLRARRREWAKAERTFLTEREWHRRHAAALMRQDPETVNANIRSYHAHDMPIEMLADVFGLSISAVNRIVSEQKGGCR